MPNPSYLPLHRGARPDYHGRRDDLRLRARPVAGFLYLVVAIGGWAIGADELSWERKSSIAHDVHSAHAPAHGGGHDGTQPALDGTLVGAGRPPPAHLARGSTAASC